MASNEPKPKRRRRRCCAGRARRGAWRAAPAERAAGGAQCRYLAVIMDGNGRWARRRHLPVAAGHRAGAKALRRLIEHALDRGILEVTVYSFSSENWRRPADEVAALMELFVEQIESEVPEVQGRGVRVRFLGRSEGVDADLLAPHRRGRGRQPGRAGHDHVHRLQLRRPRRDRRRRPRAGGVGRPRGRATTRRDGPRAGRLAELVTEDALRACLYAPEMHDPELLIRTSGEERISNFLLWQLAYTELYFTAKLWPDFGPDDLDEALAVYATRARRFGGR